MFFNTITFKRLITQAYKNGGLTIGRSNEEYFIEGRYWVMRIKTKALPKKEKAAIIELTGELPEDGLVFKATKDGNQYEIPTMEVWDINKHWKEAETEFKETKVMIMQNDTLCRILQAAESGECVLINELFLKLIDRNAIKRGEESEPEGPRAMNHASIMYWKNEKATLAAATRRIEEGSNVKIFLEKMKSSGIGEIE